MEAIEIRVTSENVRGMKWFQELDEIEQYNVLHILESVENWQVGKYWAQDTLFTIHALMNKLATAENALALNT